MIKRSIAVLAAALLCSPAAFAQGTGDAKAGEKKPTAQQQRMADCNAEAKKKTFKDNTERQGFMSACLKGEHQMTQQEKMTACNKDASAKNLKGDDRKKFMSDCLKG
jgi:uncharacterized protein YdeI (BOF family)